MEQPEVAFEAFVDFIVSNVINKRVVLLILVILHNYRRFRVTLMQRLFFYSLCQILYLRHHR